MIEKTVEVKAPLYGLDAIHRACYEFLDRLFIRLEGDPAGVVKIHLRAKPDVKKLDLEAASGELENELIHQALRERVGAANRKIREYIVTRALASAEGAEARAPKGGEPALDEDLEKEIEKLLAEVEKEGGSDPLKIAVPFEEKSEEKSKDGPSEAENAPKI